MSTGLKYELKPRFEPPEIIAAQGLILSLGRENLSKSCKLEFLDHARIVVRLVLLSRHFRH